MGLQDGGQGGLIIPTWRKSRPAALSAVFLVLFAAAIYFSSEAILCAIGEFLVLDEKPVKSDGVVVLCSGIDYYPRLIEAAELFRGGFVEKVIINGNRKSEVFRALEEKGFKSCCPWYEDPVRILAVLGVPADRVMCISAENAYDTISEAEAVGKELVQRGFSRIIVATSRFHTRRAHFIWEETFENQLSISSVAARTDPYDPASWWKQGRQVRWVMAEYGAWIYYYWKKMCGI